LPRLRRTVTADIYQICEHSSINLDASYQKQS
jgi:hypothetical protein